VPSPTWRNPPSNCLPISFLPIFVSVLFQVPSPFLPPFPLVRLSSQWSTLSPIVKPPPPPLPPCFFSPSGLSISKRDYFHLVSPLNGYVKFIVSSSHPFSPPPDLPVPLVSNLQFLYLLNSRDTPPSPAFFPLAGVLSVLLPSKSPFPP